MIKAAKSFVSWLAGGRSTHTPDAPKQSLNAAYDLARTTTQNKNHWAYADGRSANALNTPGNRKILRDRCREETANNSRLQGMSLTLSNDTIGCGPRISIPDDPIAEKMWSEWAKSINLAEKLRTMRAARIESGEVFAMQITDPKSRHIPLNVILLESEMVADPWLEHFYDLHWDDGIAFDAAWRPESYRVLRRHPGDLRGLQGWGQYDDIPAKFIWHYFVPARPGARRGRPEIISSAESFGGLRRFENATLAAAETAASPGGVLQSSYTGDGSPSSGIPFEELPISHNMLMTLPAGTSLMQFKAEHPNAQYDTFADKKIGEAARCINMPFTIAALDSSKSNLSARYLDSQIYVNTIGIDRKNKFEDEFLEWLFSEWWAVADLKNLVLTPEVPSHTFAWDNISQHADPGKEAAADTECLANGTASGPELIARNGGDPAKVQEAAARFYGCTLLEYQTLLRNKTFNNQPQQTAKPAVGDPNQEPA